MKFNRLYKKTTVLDLNEGSSGQLLHPPGWDQQPADTVFAQTACSYGLPQILPGPDQDISLEYSSVSSINTDDSDTSDTVNSTSIYRANNGTRYQTLVYSEESWNNTNYLPLNWDQNLKQMLRQMPLNCNQDLSITDRDVGSWLDPSADTRK